MLQIKIFNKEDQYALTNIVNEWLEENTKYEIKDIKFSTSYTSKEYYPQPFRFSVLIIYDDKRKE